MRHDRNKWTVTETPLPEFLRTFESHVLAENASILVAVDPIGHILWVNRAWHDVARRHGISPRFGPGSSYFDGIAPPLRDFFEERSKNALLTGQPFEQIYECSSDDTFRIYRLRVLPFGSEGLLFEHSLVVESPHHNGDIADERPYLGAHGIIVQCSNCKRVRREEAEGAAWDWVRPWGALSPPNTSHGLCPVCVGYYWGARPYVRPPK